jgi:hypothetical protein
MLLGSVSRATAAQRLDDYQERKFPSLDKEGWLRDQEDFAKQP